MQGDINDREADITKDLQVQILEHEPALLAFGATAASLDALLALAKAANDYNLVKPTLTQENVLWVKAARHPLQELTVDTFVPNDVCLSPGREAGGIALVTGPNFSGKSVCVGIGGRHLVASKRIAPAPTRKTRRTPGT